MNEIQNEWYPLPLHIAGTGIYLPERLVTSGELEAKHGLETGWCEANLGVRERRWVDGETPSYMGAAAAREAAANAAMDPEDIDLIINASGTANYERGVPDGGPLIQKQLDLENSGIPGITLQNNCLSFMTALEFCAAMLAAGRYRNILVVSSELLSLNLDTQDPQVYGRFGDGAAAAVVTLPPEGGESCIHHARIKTYGHAAGLMQSLMGLAAFRIKKTRPEDLTLKIDAPAFDKYAIQYTKTLLQEILEDSGQHIEDIKLTIPQQTGKAYLDHLSEMIPGDKIIRVFHRFGFCGAASLPMALAEAVKEERLKRGDRFLMLGAGAGMSVGGMIMTY